MARRPLTLILTALALLGAACSSGGAPRTSAPTSTTTTVPAPITVDWRGSFETALPNGWTIRDCEGDRTHVCVFDGAELLGDIELLAGYPLSPEDVASDPVATALRWARDMTTTLREDRSSGCAAFTFEPLEVEEMDVGGQPGARGGFTLTAADGTVVEHVVNHYLVVDGAMTIVNTDAYATSGGCLPPSHDDPSFTPERLAELDDGLLDRIVAESPAD